MNNIRLIKQFLVTLITITIYSCNGNGSVSVKKQKEIISMIGNKPFTYFENDRKTGKILKAATRKLNNILSGEVIQFSSNGYPKEMYFLNSSSQVVANNTLFDSLGNVDEHFYWVEDKEQLIFYYNKSMLNDSFQGHPWYVGYSKYYDPGDTIYFHINTVLIPYCSTYVTLSLADQPSSLLHYKQDLREFTAKIPSNENNTAEQKYLLRVDIVRNNGDYLLRDSSYFFVNPSSQRITH